MAATDSYQYATAGLRLSNNLEIGVEVCHTLAEDANKHIQNLKAMDLPDEAKIELLNL